MLHFNIYECLKWLEKPLWLINTKFSDITDMFNNTEAGVSKWSIKMVFLTVLQNSQENIYVGVSIKIVAGYWLIKKKLRHRCFPVNYEKFLRTPILKNFCK